MVLLSSEGVPEAAAKEQHHHEKRIEMDPHRDTLYVVGVPCGEGTRSCAERFDASTREWTSLTAPRTTRRWAGVCALGGSFYCVGGFDGIAHLNTVDRYEVATDSWLSDVAPISGPRAHVAVTSHEGLLYAAGGDDGTSCLSVAERFDPREGQWSRLPALPTRRGRAALAALGGFVYAVGGTDRTAPLRTVERYDPLANTWVPGPPLLSARASLGLVTHEGSLVAAGGGDDQLVLAFSSCERLVPEAHTWSPGPPMCSRRRGLGLAVVNGKIIAIGGFDGTTHLQTAEHLDPEANIWRQFGGLNHQHDSVGVAVLISNGDGPYQL